MRSKDEYGAGKDVAGQTNFQRKEWSGLNEILRVERTTLVTVSHGHGVQQQAHPTQEYKLEKPQEG